MARLVHKFLIWLPAALFAGAVSVGGVWPNAADWIANGAAFLWSQKIATPLGAVVTLVTIALYIAAIYATSDRPASSNGDEDRLGRKLSDKGREKLIHEAEKCVLPHPLEIIPFSASSEANRYADQIATALEEAGWDVSFPGFKARVKERGMCLGDASRPPHPAMDALSKGLKRSGAKFTRRTDEHGENRLYVDMLPD